MREHEQLFMKKRDWDLHVAGMRAITLATAQLATGVGCKVAVVVRVTDLPTEALIIRG